MREDKKIMIHSVLNHLQERDPAWAHVKMLPKFKTLYRRWAEISISHHRHPKEYYSRKWKDGWLPIDEYLSFYKYAMQ